MKTSTINQLLPERNKKTMLNKHTPRRYAPPATLHHDDEPRRKNIATRSIIYAFAPEMSVLWYCLSAEERTYISRETDVCRT